jgi:membrane fusion protein, multidrug efflux system
MEGPRMHASVAETPGTKRPSTAKRMIFTIIAVLVLIAIIAGIKVLMIMHMLAGMKPPPPAVVSTAKATYQEWQPQLRAVGSLRAARGSDLALDVAGLVTGVYVKSGDDVKQGQLLLQLRDSDDVAQLHQLEATAALAQVTFERAQREIAVKVIAQADFDQAAADLKAKQAAVAQQQVNVSKKQLRAPFAGHCGIVTINPGTYLNSGTVVVTLQQLDPVYVDFRLPQEDLGQVHPGLEVRLTLDAFPGESFPGKITAADPLVDSASRNFQAEATVPNAARKLLPGMFVRVAVLSGTKQHYLTLPQTAVTFNPYGSTVFLVQKDDKGKATAQQVFVTTGPTRGDQIAVLKGVKDGDQVVTSGQLKLKNGTPLDISTQLQPADDAHPTPQEH